MSRPGDSLWSNIDALHRLARVERRSNLNPHPTRNVAGLPPEAFPPFADRPEFGVHTVEAPMTLASGDFCDTFLIAPETLAVVVADVSGKGVAAAMVRGVARSVIRNTARDSASPGELLARLDKILSEAELGSMFLTAFVGWYDTRQGILRYANAGHPVPFRITREGEVQPFGGVTGSIVGILGGQRFEDGEGRLAAGERLVLYTDGVTEAANADEEPFGSLRLVHLLNRQARATADELAAQVVHDVRRHEGQERQDDVSLLILDRHA
jgi:sigma-B regulation protein RsbU (phosphoserine phosphatase)